MTFDKLKTEAFYLHYHCSPLPWTAVLPGFGRTELFGTALSYVGKLPVHRIPLQKWSDYSASDD